MTQVWKCATKRANWYTAHSSVSFLFLTTTASLHPSSHTLQPGSLISSQMQKRKLRAPSDPGWIKRSETAFCFQETVFALIISSTAMKKHLDFIKARSPRGQLMHRASSIKLAFADEPGFESLGTNRIKLRRETKHSQCRRRPYLSFLRYLLFSPARCSSPLLIYTRWTERTLFSARTGAVNTS